ncbi:MAG: glycosyltransferase family 2 protein [Verrucomicrobiota bacterium]|jgi:glycosyltransferase involved in cell wall biosynthesis
MTPLVSILIPAHNAEAWIADTIQSALAQTWPGKEIIVVDDGSKDQTRSVANQFASRGVSIVTQTNQGAAAARNKAFSLCQGDYVQWLDADDLLASDKIKKQMEALDRWGTKRTLFSAAWGRFIYRPSKASFAPTPLWCDLSPVEWLLRKMGQNIFMQTGVWLVSRELTEAAGPWDTRLLADDDGEYFSRVLLASDGTRFIPEAKVFYRLSDLNLSLSYIGRSNKKLDAHFLSMKLQIGYLRSLEDSARTRAVCLEYLNSLLIYFYPERLDIVRQMEQLASTLGGRLAPPRLSWKYAWIQKTLGWTAAKRTQLFYNQYKSSALRSWDKLLFRLKI